MNHGQAVLSLSVLLALGTWATSACSPASPQPGPPAKSEAAASRASNAQSSPDAHVVHFRSSAAIWFQPEPPGVNGPFGDVGSTDFFALFRPGAPWPQVLARTEAVGFDAAWLYSAPSQELRAIVTFLNAHNIGIEIEAPALQARSTCGSGVEGYVPFGLPGGLNLKRFTLAYLDRLRALGAHVTFMKVDEPYYYGSVVSDAVLRQIAQATGEKNTPVSCHFPMAEVARDVGQFAHLVKSVYPNIEIGDVEPVRPGAYQPDAVTALDAWHETYRSVTGAPFPFFFADVDFADPGWPALVRQLETSTRHLGIRFGIIYTGDQQDGSNAEWTSQVVTRFEQYQRQARGQPDYVLFQSWQPRPTLCLPESDPATFTGAIDTYIAATAAN
jgi:hypothetical protein